MKKILVLLAVFAQCFTFADDFEIAMEALDKDDYKKAAQYSEKACDIGNAKACFILSNLYSMGLGVKKDQFKNIEYCQKACDGGHATSCYIIGLRYENGKGAEKDYKQAKAYFQKACDLKDERGCGAYTKLTKQGY